MITTNYSQANVTISGNIGLPKPTATQTVKTIMFSGKATTNVIYTVTAGKTFYCLGASIGHNGTDGREVGFACDGTQVTKQMVGAVATVGHAPTLSGGVVFTCAATKDITVISNTTGTLQGCIWGYEE